MKVPKGLASHPAVEMVETADTNGSDYKYIVWLKDGYYFTSGRAEGCTGSAGFETVADFLLANPQKKG